MKILCFVIPIVLFIQSCDTPRIFEVKVSNNPNVSFTIYANNDYFKSTSLENKEKIKIVLPITNKIIRRDTMFIYGFGCSWNDSTLMDFSRTIDSIQIRGVKRSLDLTNQIEIYNYLKKNRHGRKRLIINVK